MVLLVFDQTTNNAGTDREEEKKLAGPLAKKKLLKDFLEEMVKVLFRWICPPRLLPVKTDSNFRQQQMGVFR